MAKQQLDENERKQAEGSAYDPEGTTMPLVPEMCAAPCAAVEPWPDPLPLPAALPPVPSLTADMLPESLRAYLVDIAERLDCPLDYVAIPALVGLSSIVGRRCTVRPKQHDPWPVVPNLWGTVVGLSGFLKSPAISAALYPLRQLQAQTQPSTGAAKKPSMLPRWRSKRNGKRSAAPSAQQPRKTRAPTDWNKAGCARQRAPHPAPLHRQ